MKVRCIDEGCSGKLRLGTVYTVVEKNILGNYILDGLGMGGHSPRRFEPVTDEEVDECDFVPFIPEGAVGCEFVPSVTEQPKVDPYEGHRLKLEADGLHECDMSVMTASEQPGATARLHAGLEGEKVRERVKAFPHPARNPR